MVKQAREVYLPAIVIGELYYGVKSYPAAPEAVLPARL